MKKVIIILAATLVVLTAQAQRTTDVLSRGLVAVPAQSGSGNFVSWRILGEEYYDYTYNLYCNGVRIASGLTTSSYVHSSGNAQSKYSVAAVFQGHELDKCDAVQAWSQQYKIVNLQAPVDRNGVPSASYYDVNDVSLGDLNGDGISEFIIKRPCSVSTDMTQKTKFHHLDCYDINSNRLWWIDLGPNMQSGADEQWDAVCFDWDRDGKAEVLLRIADNAYIHYANGDSLLIGSASVDTRFSGMEYTNTGNEYLLYLEGATGKPYQIGPTSHPNYLDYPLPRGLDSDWGEGILGHRSTKHYFAAPYLDGRHASIFLGRGAYTKHAMKAFDVDPATHKLTLRWTWENSVGGSPWYGQGYHNFAVGDVDWDGRDEIIFGSMVIDDNGKGLSTSGFGHGDAQHCSDFDPYRMYEEQFCCNESQPANNYRNAVTSELYYRQTGSSDDGRALMGNFSNAYPGSVGRSVGSGWIGSCASKIIDALNGDALIPWSDLNARIYWDGDLLDEYMDSPGTAKAGVVYKAGTGARLVQCVGTCINYTKNNACAIGDIFGDWREELILNYGGTGIVIYTTNYATSYRIPTLWSDHQYRNAMVWQSMGYNQPPHKSYFLGEMEGITAAPPTNTMTGRTEVADGGIISTPATGAGTGHLIVCDTKDTHVSIAEGANPYIVTFDVPSWVQGSAQSNISAKTSPITYTTFTCNVTGSALTGNTRLVKTGSGTLTLPAVDMQHTGATDLWRGVTNFHGSAANSAVTLSRFAELNSHASNATFKSIAAEYGSVVRPGGANNVGVINATTYKMGFGSRLVIDINSETNCDKLQTGLLTVEKKNWTFGPKYLTPVIEFVSHAETLTPGTYIVGRVDSLVGSLDDIKIEGLGSMKTALSIDASKNLCLTIEDVRNAASTVWTGSQSNVWDFASTPNFYLLDDETKTPNIFVANDKVHFTDEAAKTAITLKTGAELPTDTLFFEASKNFTLSGSGIINAGTLVKSNTGTLTIGNDNTYTGGNILEGGVVKVSSLSNSTQAYGNLGGLTTTAAKFTIADGAELQTTSAVKQGSPMLMSGEGGVIRNTSTFTMEKDITGTTLTKLGAGYFDMQGTLRTNKLIVGAGTFYTANTYSKTVYLEGTGGINGDGFLASPIYVEAGAKATLTMTNTYYQAHSGKLTGSGTITFVPVNTVSRVRITGDWSQFTGTVKHTNTSIWLPLDASTGLAKGTLDIAEGCTVTNVCKAFAIGKLTGKGSLAHPVANFINKSAVSGNNTWNVGNSDEALGDFTFNGTITDAGGTNKAIFNKVGNCKMKVTTSWTNSGAVTVKAGELHFNTGVTLGSGALIVANGATLSGISGSTKTSAEKNPMTNASITISGTLQIGLLATSTSASILNVGGKNLTINATGKLHVGMTKCATASTVGNTYFYNVGTLNIKAGATIEGAFPEDGFNYTATEETPDSIILWKNVTKATVGKLNFNLPSLAEGYVWDTSKASDGVLYIRVAPTGIDSPQSSVISYQSLYDLSGRCLNASEIRNIKDARKGVYIVDGKKVVR